MVSEKLFGDESLQLLKRDEHDDVPRSNTHECRNEPNYYTALQMLRLVILMTTMKLYNTCSSPYVTLIKPSSSLKVTHRSFRHASPHLWNQLPTSLRIPHPNYSSPSQRPSFEHASLTCYTLLSPSITFSMFHSELKTYLFRKFYPPP